MEGIESVVSGVTEYFEKNEQPISKVLMQNPSEFRPDEEISESSLKRLVEQSIHRLSEKNMPPLEMLKMQVGFDEACVENEDEVEKELLQREEKLKKMQSDILNCSPKNLNDYDTLVLLYRQIFSYLLIHWNGPMNRSIEREIAAAMESVFPRTGLKVFVALSPSDKISQLSELSSIVLGIRLFNKSCGKGGAGIENTRESALMEVESFRQSLRDEIHEIRETCSRYKDCLYYCLGTNGEGHIDRWKDELSNRRQYLMFLEQLERDASESYDQIHQCSDVFVEELKELKEMVGAKASVPKDVVYPRFESLANHWSDLVIIRKKLLASIKTLEVLRQFKNTYTPTLTIDIIRKSRNQSTLPAAILSEDPPALLLSPSEASVDPENAATRLPMQSSPEFMNLPLEFDGYCPWTLTRFPGMLVPGEPSLGIVRYKNAFFAFSSEQAVQAFLKNPEFYLSHALESLKKKPELVNLLKMTQSFPEISIPDLIGKKGLHALKEAPKMVDASTETPVHFVESYIDHSYEWNEWNLRRKALQTIRLTQSKTVKVQTERSHFRKTDGTQHFPSYESSTQTMRDSGTNPVVRSNYVTGLRGAPDIISGVVKFQNEMQT